ncbi:AAEL012643-PA [Aedes aegypti]|uniref:AAEL012643-PA n=2 Tax=Aedes aegypti TaxID=7159 RepID=Q1DH33_AEDAE|nr:uncharacterized protein LOC5576625 [Aedes aegypti]EAT32461.1 AAEL015252-PA [Aedes aegypti]EAT35175.1 AAEL012643-PA [Aedes aegypti]
MPGVLNRAATTDILYPTVPACDGTRPVICTGCRTMKICVGLPEPNNPTQLCRTETPFCDSETGACSTLPDTSHAECSKVEPPNVSPLFYCTGKGFYPDPYSCSSYYYCEGESVPGDRYQCPPGYKYNSKAKLCHRVPIHCKPELCEELSCEQTAATFKPYPLDSKYYYYCQYDESDPTPRILMLACDDGASFDQNLSRCVFRCPREGLFAKSSNRNKYFQCYRANRKFVYAELSCPIPAQVFDDVKKVCVTESV